MAVLTLAGCLAVWMSAAPTALLPLPLLLGVLTMRQHAAMPGELVQFGADGSVRVLPATGRGSPDDAANGRPAQLIDVAERGPLLVVGLRIDGRVQRRCFLPDSASVAQRRLLRLWLQRHQCRHADAFAMAGVR